MSKIWFITGAGSGIGAGIARAALQAGDRVVATGRNRAGGDEFNQVGHQQQAVGVIGGQTRIAGLTETAAMTDGAEGPPAIVVTLCAPGRASRVVQSRVQGEIEFDIPFQTINHGSGSANSEDGRVIGNVIRDGVPVAGRRFGRGSIRPEFRERACVVPA